MSNAEFAEEQHQRELAEKDAEIERLRATLAALVAAHDTLQQRNFQGGPADYEQQRDALRAAWKAARECISA